MNDSQRLLRALEVFYVSGVPWSEHIARHKEHTKGVRFTNTLQLGLTTNRDNLYQRINRRCEIMLDCDLEGEVKKLLAMGYDRKLKPFGSIGYRHMINFIDGTWTKDEVVRLLARDTRRYAKRQYTWFSKLTALQWFNVDENQKILQAVKAWYAKLPKQ